MAVVRTTEEGPAGEHRCVRCGGFVVWTHIDSPELTVDGDTLRLRRCVNCGDLQEESILANRKGGSPGEGRRAPTPRSRHRIVRL